VSAIAINAERLLTRIRTLGQVGRDADGALTRLAGSDADKAARDVLVSWMTSAGLDVHVDGIGNVFGCWGWRPDAPVASDVSGEAAAPIMIGSHIDTVVDAGIYDGAYGVLAALEVVESLREASGGAEPAQSIVVAAFTNEEGVRYTPDMMGSLVHAGGLSLDQALAARAIDGGADGASHGVTLGEELARIGYAGSLPIGAIAPRAYLELHIEQGPILEHERCQIGAVENLQGISWQRIIIEGEANHAGTTPMSTRRDAGAAAARVITFLREYATLSNGTVATVGKLRVEPDAINIIPALAVLTADIRDRDNTRLLAAEAALTEFLTSLGADEGVRITTERLVRFDPVTFDARLVDTIEQAARNQNLRVRRMTSGAGHDAQMMARICPAAMIFVPSEGGISHNPREHTADADLVAGARVLCEVVTRLSASR
jgi:beta-ureidopropionase / N-carbamoyl-L-amino-acid hydrolase